MSSLKTKPAPGPSLLPTKLAKPMVWLLRRSVQGPKGRVSWCYDDKGGRSVLDGSLPKNCITICGE